MYWHLNDCLILIKYTFVYTYLVMKYCTARMPLPVPTSSSLFHKIHQINPNYESVWIELILLKLKTENWKHCNKIIFKYMNNFVRPIVNKKVGEKWSSWNPWIVHGYTVHCWLGQQLWLKQKKKKGKPRLKTSTWIQTHT